MKEILKKSFSWETLKPFAIGFSTVLLLEYIIFPGLSIKNFILNLLSGTLLVGLIIFTIYYFRFFSKKIPKMSARPKEK